MYKKGASDSHHIVLLAIVGVVALIGLVLAFGGGRGDGVTGAVTASSNSQIGLLQDQINTLTVAVNDVKQTVAGLADSVTALGQEFTDVTHQSNRGRSFIMNGPAGTLDIGPQGNPGDVLGFKITDDGTNVRVTANNPLYKVGNVGDSAGQPQIIVPRSDSVSGTTVSFWVFTADNQNAIEYGGFHIHTDAVTWIITIQGPMRFMGGVPQIDAFAGNGGGIS